MGHVLVMGRRTFESIGKALPGRETFVLTRSDFSHPDVNVIHSLDEVAARHSGRDCFIAGGAQVYEQALPQCSDLFLTLVKREVEGDVFFPEYENWFKLIEVLRDEEEFSITHYRNRDQMR